MPIKALQKLCYEPVKNEMSWFVLSKLKIFDVSIFYNVNLSNFIERINLVDGNSFEDHSDIISIDNLSW